MANYSEMSTKKGGLGIQEAQRRVTGIRLQQSILKEIPPEWSHEWEINCWIKPRSGCGIPGHKGSTRGDTGGEACGEPDQGQKEQWKDGAGGLPSHRYTAGKITWVPLGGIRRGEKLDKNFGALLSIYVDNRQWAPGNYAEKKHPGEGVTQRRKVSQKSNAKKSSGKKTKHWLWILATWGWCIIWPPNIIQTDISLLH